MKTKQTKVCCVTGHRPKGFPWDYNRKHGKEQREYLATLRRRIVKLIEEYGCNYFITGCAIGADLDFAEICIKLRDKKYPHIFIEGAIPCYGQDAKWSDSCKKRYAQVLEKLDKVHYVSQKFSMACFQKRNEYMVDRSDIVFAVWNSETQGGTWNTIAYARKKMKDIKYLFLGFCFRDKHQWGEAFYKYIQSYNYQKTKLAWQRIEQKLAEKEQNKE